MYTHDEEARLEPTSLARSEIAAPRRALLLRWRSHDGIGTRGGTRSRAAACRKEMVQHEVGCREEAPALKGTGHRGIELSVPTTRGRILHPRTTVEGDSK